MRKRRHSFDPILVPRNESCRNRQEHPSKRFLQMHCSTFITFIEMHWNNLATSCTLKYDAIVHFIKIFISDHGQHIKLGQFSLVHLKFFVGPVRERCYMFQKVKKWKVLKWFFWFVGKLVVIVAFRKSHPNIWKHVLLIWIGTPIFNRFGGLMGKKQTNPHQTRHDLY